MESVTKSDAADDNEDDDWFLLDLSSSERPFWSAGAAEEANGSLHSSLVINPRMPSSRTGRSEPDNAVVFPSRRSSSPVHHRFSMLILRSKSSGRSTFVDGWSAYVSRNGISADRTTFAFNVLFFD